MTAECAVGQQKGRWRLPYRKSEVNQHSLKINFLACIVLYNIYIEKDISRKFVIWQKCQYKKISKRILEIMSRKCDVDNPKDAAILRNNILNYLWNRKELYNDL